MIKKVFIEQHCIDPIEFPTILKYILYIEYASNSSPKVFSKRAYDILKKLP